MAIQSFTPGQMFLTGSLIVAGTLAGVLVGVGIERSGSDADPAPTPQPTRSAGALARVRQPEGFPVEGGNGSAIHAYGAAGPAANDSQWARLRDVIGQTREPVSGLPTRANGDAAAVILRISAG
jgi:hypothetical protein